MSTEEISANCDAPAPKKFVRFNSDVSVEEQLYSSSSESSQEDVPTDNEADEGNRQGEPSEPPPKRQKRYTVYSSHESRKLGTSQASVRAKQKVKEQRESIHRQAIERKKTHNPSEIVHKGREMSIVNFKGELANNNSLLKILDSIVKYIYLLSTEFEPKMLVTLTENIAKGKQYEDVENEFQSRGKEILTPNYPKDGLRGKILDACKQIVYKSQTVSDLHYPVNIEEITDDEEFFRQLLIHLHGNKAIALEKVQQILTEKVSEKTNGSVITYYLQQHPGIMCCIDNATLERILKFRIDRTSSLDELDELIKNNAYIFYRLGKNLINNYSVAIHNLTGSGDSVEEMLNFITCLGGLRKKCRSFTKLPPDVRETLQIQRMPE